MRPTFEEYLAFYEKLFGIQLFEYQKILLRSEYEKAYGGKQSSATKECQTAQEDQTKETG
jgi:hypothetical protein